MEKGRNKRKERKKDWGKEKWIGGKKRGLEERKEDLGKERNGRKRRKERNEG